MHGCNLALQCEEVNTSGYSGSIGRVFRSITVGYGRGRGFRAIHSLGKFMRAFRLFLGMRTISNFQCQIGIMLKWHNLHAKNRCGLWKLVEAQK